MDTNVVYCADNLDFMRAMESESVDLIYADPPFYTQRDFTDFNDMFDGMDGYIDFMRARMGECHRVLKSTGSIYVHLDWHAVHYVKVMMDEIFGMNNFRNEIVWGYSGGGVPKRDYPRKHDTILRYSKTNEYTFNIEYKPYAPSTSRHTDGSPLNEKGTPVTTFWSDLKGMSLVSKERMGYPTQKPEKLLERIIKASSNPGDIVLDPFCGCGTAVVVAEKIGRKYIGIDNNPRAIEMTRKRVGDINEI